MSRPILVWIAVLALIRAVAGVLQGEEIGLYELIAFGMREVSSMILLIAGAAELDSSYGFGICSFLRDNGKRYRRHPRECAGKSSAYLTVQPRLSF